MTIRHESTTAGRGTPTVFVGAATLDAIALTARFPEPDERLVADDVGFAGGGPAATAAVAFARLGGRAAFIGAVGDDHEGRRIRDELAAEGVDLSGLAVRPGHRTAASVVVVDRGRATRAICTRPGPPLELGSAERELLTSAPWVHADHVGWAPVHGFLRASGPVPARPRVSVDAGNPVPGLALADVDLYVPTLDALRRQYGDRNDDLEELLRAALADGADTVVATLGAAGSAAAARDGRWAREPALPVSGTVSTLGAGDVFHGALLAALAQDEDLAACLRYANAAAALSCRGLDGRSAIPGHSEVVAALAVPSGRAAAEPPGREAAPPSVAPSAAPRTKERS